MTDINTTQVNVVRRLTLQVAAKLRQLSHSEDWYYESPNTNKEVPTQSTPKIL